MIKIVKEKTALGEIGTEGKLKNPNWVFKTLVGFLSFLEENRSFIVTQRVLLMRFSKINPDT